MKKGLLLMCCCLFVVNLVSAQQQEVLDSTFSTVDPPTKLADIFAGNVSIISNTQKKILADNFELRHRSKITRFSFIGQIGKMAPGDISLITGVHVFVFTGDVYDNRKKVPFSGASKAHFYLDNTNGGLVKRIEDEKVVISVDLELAEKELLLESGSYWIAFAPVIAVDGLPEDKVWYWYIGNGGGYDTLLWNSRDMEWNNGNVASVAFSVEGKRVTLGIPELDTYTAVTTVFPNPSNGVFKITTASKEITAVSVCNLSGQLVLQGTSGIIDLSVFPKGIYLGTVTYNDGTKTKEKLIKI